VAESHRHGLKVFAFTINRPAEITRMKMLGVDGVFSDFPERLAD
jgi:glycerophosphoryl diester phosphodiesterase